MDSSSESSTVEMVQMAGNPSLQEVSSSVEEEKISKRRSQNPILRARNKIWIFLDVPTSSKLVCKSN